MKNVLLPLLMVTTSQSPAHWEVLPLRVAGTFHSCKVTAVTLYNVQCAEMDVEHAVRDFSDAAEVSLQCPEGHESLATFTSSYFWTWSNLQCFCGPLECKLHSCRYNSVLQLLDQAGAFWAFLVTFHPFLSFHLRSTLLLLLRAYAAMRLAALGNVDFYVQGFEAITRALPKMEETWGWRDIVTCTSRHFGKKNEMCLEDLILIRR